MQSADQHRRDGRITMCAPPEEQAPRCGIGWGSLGVTSIMVALIALYFLLYCLFLFRALHQLRANSNVEFKLANTIVRVQVHNTLSLTSFV